MRKTVTTIGEWLFAAGILASLAWLLYVGFLFATKVVPFFWSHGDYTPAFLAATVVAMVAGGILMSFGKESAH